MLVAIGNPSDYVKDHQILFNDSTTKFYMFNVENSYSKQSDSQNAKINVYKHKIKKPKHSKEKNETVLVHETSFEMNRMYSFSKTFSQQKIGFWGNLDHLGKSLLSNALNRDNLPCKQN